MKRTAVASKAFAAHGYDPNSLTLEIQYHSGAIYQHKGVPAAVYAAFLVAPSMGAYLNSHIKPIYPAERQADAVQVWICGRCLDQTPEGIVWELQGVFTTEQSAADTCADETYFVGPETLDVALPAETTLWQGAYYPHLIGDVLATMQPEEV
jgi:hypothetical protein